MTVLYFTSTGNCLYIAKKLGGTLCSIPQAIKTEKDTFEDDAIGIIFPVYGLCVPPYVTEFITKAHFKTNYLFAVITYGFYDGGTTNHLLETAKKSGLYFSYINKLKMVENYLPGFEMKKEIQMESKRQIDEHLRQILSDVKTRKQMIHCDSWFDRLMTNMHLKNYGYKIGEGETKKYHLAPNCNGCGTCVHVCPTDNIHLDEKRPVFGSKCLSCLACTQNCPQNAIRMDGEKSTTRFRNKNITLEEMIAANR
ncbi:MAG TPA: EFR1 family ferrodoxin [Oscillospiraceae bacterium]|nr:EFR1 family ferrodoxin [Oscillospiraceae bacterium]